MDAVHLGPLVLPMYVVLPLVGLGVANAAAAWFRSRRGIDVGPVLWKMTLTCFVVARLVFVLRHHDLYVDAPLAALDFRDGGFDSSAGLLAALVVGAELARRSVSLRRPLAIATLAGCAAWLGGTMLNQALTPAGAPLPTIEVRRMDGTTVPLNSFAGRPLVINLWATWCPPCRREMPALMRAQQDNPDVEFVFVNQGESAETVQRYLATQGLKMTNIVIDPAKELSVRTGSPGYPTTLFYDTAGKLQFRHVGELSQATVREKIEALNRVSSRRLR